MGSGGAQGGETAGRCVALGFSVAPVAGQRCSQRCTLRLAKSGVRAASAVCPVICSLVCPDSRSWWGWGVPGGLSQSTGTAVPVSVPVPSAVPVRPAVLPPRASGKASWGLCVPAVPVSRDRSGSELRCPDSRSSACPDSGSWRGRGVSHGLSQTAVTTGVTSCDRAGSVTASSQVTFSQTPGKAL